MADKAVYNLESINKVIDLMDKELSVSGIQNIKTIANIHEILVSGVEVINDTPEQEEYAEPVPEGTMIPTEATAQEIYNADDDVVEVDATAETVAEETVTDPINENSVDEVDSDDNCNDCSPC